MANIVTTSDVTKTVTITSNDTTLGTVNQGSTSVVQVSSQGPQGPTGPQGSQGDKGNPGELSSFENLTVTGSLFVSGANGNITASGNIRASGYIAGDFSFKATQTGFRANTLGRGGVSIFSTSDPNIDSNDFVIGTNNTANKFIFKQTGLLLVSGSGTRAGDIEAAGNITASGNVSSSLTSTASFGLYLGDGSQLTGVQTVIDSSSFAITGSNVLFANITSSGNISASETILGGGLDINGPSNSHIEVGTYNVGYDTMGVDTAFITGSGLIISGAMADLNHHNMLKIGNIELIDLNTVVSSNEFLIHNVNSLKITSGSDGGDIAENDGRLFEHNGTSFTLFRNNSPTMTVNTNDTLTFNGDHISFVSGPGGTSMRATNTTATSSYILTAVANPNSSPKEIKSIKATDFFRTVGGNISASAVSASGTIYANDLILDYDSLPSSDPSNKGQVYRSGSNQLFISPG